MDGIIVIDKPCDYTSFDVVAVMRRLSGEKKVGHTGTLDPMATGALPILFGSATKVQVFMKDTDKVYDAVMKLGITTDTQDITGKVTSESSLMVCEKEFKSVLNRFKGEINQIPPMYSAIKKDGKKLYELAREGKEIEREPRKIAIKDIRLLDFNSTLNTARIIVRCSKGTYIRTLCSEIGQALGCGAAMLSLRRTESNGFSIEESVTLKYAESLSSSGKLDTIMMKADAVLKDYIRVEVTYPQAVRFSNGGGLALDRIPEIDGGEDNDIIRVYYLDVFIGLGRMNLKNEELSVLKIFNKEINQKTG